MCLPYCLALRDLSDLYVAIVFEIRSEVRLQLVSDPPVKTIRSLLSFEKAGATRRSRTGDLLITNQLLYRLS